MFEATRALEGQMRTIAGMAGGGSTGLDMNAALGLGAAMGCDMELLAGVLPAVEAALLARQSDNDAEDALPGEEGD